MFRAAYQDRIEPIPDRSQWPEVDLGFKVFPPVLGRPPGRPRVQRIRGCLENNPTKKKVRCKRSVDFGHFAKHARILSKVMLAKLLNHKQGEGLLCSPILCFFGFV
jgi:hypothetical protein